MARILYISPEHVSGTLALFQRGHRARGHDCRYVTFFPSAYNYPEDICLNLGLMPDSPLIRRLRAKGYKSTPEMLGRTDRSGFPPYWRPDTAAEAIFFQWRDLLLSGKIGRAIRRFGLDQFDLYHLDQGLDFFRDARFVRRMKKRGATVTCFYHGTDLRNRGAIPAVDALSQLNMTSELDLLDRHPHIRYLHLPYEVEKFQVKSQENSPLLIGHACRAPSARHFKGTDAIIAVVKELESIYPVKLDFVEGLPHDETLKRKARWDIAIDQIADQGGWGYGVNSLETLSMGIPTCTRMNPQCEKFFAGHPFIHVDENTLKSKLIELIENPSYRRAKAQESRQYVMRRHSVESVMDELYGHYREAGIHLEAGG
jgi:glycosyltransferase involved in cell wall biosynthesis